MGVMEVDLGLGIESVEDDFMWPLRARVFASGRVSQLVAWEREGLDGVVGSENRRRAE